MYQQLIDMAGKKIGWWTVIERTDPPAHVKSARKQAWWLCRCKCGTQKPTLGAQLRSGKSKSCGCRCYKRNSVHANIKTRYPKHHNLKNTSIYTLWNHMLLKCYQENFLHFKNYGAKGITVCDEWRRVESFVSWSKGKWKKGYSLELKEGATIFSPDTAFWIPKGDKISRMKKKNGKVEYRDLVGKKFGALTVLEETMTTSQSGHRRRKLKCICRCENICFALPHSLISGRTITCGCGKFFEWSRFFEKCIECDKSDSRHACKGVCFRCYQRKRDFNIRNDDQTEKEMLKLTQGLPEE